MFALVVIGIFILIIALIIFIEYKNEKKYQEERLKRSNERRKTRAPYDPKVKVQKPLQEEKKQKAKKRATIPGAKEKVSPEISKTKTKTTADTYSLKENKQKPAEVIEEIQQEIPNRTYDLPKCKYPKFDHSRLLDMGLNEDEVKEFVQELIPQINNQIPLIKEAMKIPDFHSMERLTHSIKGSSTTVGTGGISDLLVEYNTYLKKGQELPIIEAYFTHLVQYAKELEEQYA